MFKSLVCALALVLPILAWSQSSLTQDRTGQVRQIQSALQSRDFSSARQLLSPLVAASDPWAVFVLSSLERRGLGGERNFNSSFLLSKQLAERGYPPGQTEYARHLIWGIGTAKDVPEGVRLLNMAASRNERAAINLLGILHYEGLGVKQDYAEMHRYWEKAAQQGSAAANGSLAFAYMSGVGVSIDLRKAFELAKKSSDEGSGWGSAILGKMYAEGNFVERDKTKAIEYFELAEKRDDIVGMVGLAEILLSERPLNKPVNSIKSILERAIKDDNVTEIGQKAKLSAMKMLVDIERISSTGNAMSTQAAGASQGATSPSSTAPTSIRIAHALVVGNAAYPGSGRLDNPVNDATAISQKLRAMGFTVTTVTDANRQRLVQAMSQFRRTAASADVSLLFYSGHGVQVFGKNYMLPIDVDQTDVAQATIQGVSLNEVVENFLPGKTKLVFLDACRDNPLQRTGDRSVSRGLAPIAVAEGTLIAYATKDGQVASDGTGQRNSPFTQALLEHLSDPSDIAVVLRKVREKVMRATGGKQQPWEYGSLTGGELVLSAIRR
jgi:TPR repeat protein